jgi:hypothetical protein
MKGNAFKGLLFCWLMAESCVPVHGALTTNSWIGNLGGKWEAAGSWSAGTPSISQADVIISNGFFSPVSPNKAVSVDSTTASGSPGSMTISNLIISAPLVHLGLQTQQGLNGLIITNTAPTTFTILNTVLLTTGSVMSVSNSPVHVESQLIDNGYLELDLGALLTTTPPSVSYVGYDRVAQMAVTGGVWQTGNTYVGYNSGSAGLLELSSGTVVLFNDSTMYAGYNGGADGSILITGGQLIVTNAAVELGYEGSGEMMVSNGTVQGSINVCGFDGQGTGVGTLTVAGGTVDGNVDVSFSQTNGVGTVWLTGGQIINEDTLYLGDGGIGQMTVSNGTLVTDGLEVGFFSGSQGTLTIAGGTNVFSSFVHVGRGGTKATVWMTGGLLFTTNDLTNIGDAGGDAHVIVSNGVWQSQRIRVGSSGEAICTLTLDGGTTTVSSNLEIGLFGCGASGVVTVVGGSLYVTNAAHNAVLDVESGTFTLNSGTVVVDQFVMTNTCANFVRTGGTLIYGSAVLNPNLDADGDGFANQEETQTGTDPLDPNSTPLHVASIIQQGNDVALAWRTTGGKTNVVQVAKGAVGGGYSNTFTDLSPILVPTGAGLITTNYLDVGGATNSPARFYRIRLVP